VTAVFFPLDEQLGLPEKHWSAGVVRRVTWLSSRLSYGEVCEVLAEEGDVALSKSTVWGLVQTWGAAIGQALAAEETEIKTAAREWSTPGGPVQPGERMGVALDGAMMNIREEGWKEFKVGCVYDVELRRERDPRTGDWGEYGHAVNLSYGAHLGGPEVFGWQMWTEAQRRGWHQAQAGIVQGDGAKWIWNLRDEHFPYSETVVDWYHATEYLGTAKQLLYPEGGAAATQWYNRQETRLYQGHTRQIADDLTQAARPYADTDTGTILTATATYFRNNRDHMQYQELRDSGWPIGSGMIESGAKQFKHRFTGPGMRWSRQGAKNLLPVRAAVLTSKARGDELWSRSLHNSPPN